jgi:hypothetical protein
MRGVSRACLGGGAVLLATLLAITGVSSKARADTLEACVAAVEEGQKLERAGRLQGARTVFLTCDNARCPAEVRSVCDRLLNKVEGEQPTVILGARDATGKDLVVVRVSVDGAPLVDSLDGKAVAIDPGPHTIRFEHAGDPPIEQSLVIREADKARPVVVTFAGQVAPPGPTTPGRERPGRPIPTLVYALGGVGVAALGVFVGLDVSGQSRYSACKSVACSSSTFDSISVERDVTLTMAGLGVASLGAAAWFFFTRPAEPRSSSALHFDVDGRRGGGVLRAVGTF